MTASTPDSDSLRYATYWEPVLAPPGRRMLQRIEVTPRTYLDVGAGTGALALAAAERWPEARIVALDASVGMLSVGRQRVASERSAVDAERFRWLPADAAAIPLGDACIDVVTVSFTLQVVEDRRAVLREMLRVLRPGGVLGIATWMAGDLLLAADDAFAEVVAGMDLGEQSRAFRPARTTDYVNLAEAHDDLVAVGFRDVDARADELHYVWTRDEYLVFKECYDDRHVFESLDDGARQQLRVALRRRWAELPELDFSVRAPLVSAVARRPRI